MEGERRAGKKMEKRNEGKKEGKGRRGEKKGGRGVSKACVVLLIHDNVCSCELNAYRIQFRRCLQVFPAVRPPLSRVFAVCGVWSSLCPSGRQSQRARERTGTWEELPPDGLHWDWSKLVSEPPRRRRTHWTPSWRRIPTYVVQSSYRIA